MVSVYEEKSIPRAVRRVALPAMFGQLTTLIYNLADTWFVAMTGDANMVAAVTLCGPILLILMSIPLIFGMGGSSVIARRLGEREEEKAARALNFCSYAMLAVGVVTLFLGLLLLTPITKLSGANTENFSYTRDYLFYIFLGTPVAMLSTGLLHILRSVGLVREGTAGLVLGNATNIVLDYIFIGPLGMGTAGAALATSLGFAATTLFYLFCVLREMRHGSRLFRLSPRFFILHPALLRDVVSIGIPGALITILMSVSNVVLNNYLSIYGSSSVAAYGIASKIDSVAIMLAVGLSQGVTPLVGFYYGAGTPDRTAKAMRTAIAYATALTAALMAIFLLASEPLAGLFLKDPTLIRESGRFLRILVLSAPTMGVINIVTGYFQALGKPAQSLLITVLRNIVLFIPAVIVLNLFFQLTGVIAAQPVAEWILCFVCLGLYWKYRPRMN